jgi:hypothetical protein
MEAQPHDRKPFELLNAKYRHYDYEFERYWHFFQAFGRVGYDPSTPAEVCARRSGSSRPWLTTEPPPEHHRGGANPLLLS